MLHKLGAHLSIAGGHVKALQSMADKGGNALQIFSASPRGWNFAKLDEETIAHFVHEKVKLGIDPIYFHASYLINLGNTEKLGDLSKNLLVNELKLASKMKIKGSVVHIGSFKQSRDEYTNPLNFPYADFDPYGDLVVKIKEVLERTPEDTLLLIENAGNRKLCQHIDELAIIMEAVDNPRVKVCLDTCHLHAAGYNLSSKEKFDRFMDMFDSTVGIDKIELFHVNDSKDPFNSCRDRHENLGEGQVGTDVFRFLLNDPRTKDKSFIIETPGFDDKGPDKLNMDIMKSYITE